MRCAIVALVVAVVLSSTSALASAAALLAPTDVLRLLKQGGVTLLVRHGQTESGIGDPPGFTLSDCATQRNLSAAGRAELRMVAATLSAAGVKFTQVLSSEWCRCRETARILVGRERTVLAFPALNSQFADNKVIEGANSKVIEKIRAMPGTEAWLMVTHQVNISALVGVGVAMGEGVLVRPAAGGVAVVGRVKL